MVPGRGFKSERSGGSRVERLGRIAIKGEADARLSIAVILATERERMQNYETPSERRWEEEVRNVRYWCEHNCASTSRWRNPKISPHSIVVMIKVRCTLRAYLRYLPSNYLR